MAHGVYIYIHTHTHTQNLFTNLFPGLPRWAGARRNLLVLNGAREDIRGRHTYNPAWHHSIQTNQRPTSFIPIFMPDVLPVASLPIYPDLGQAPRWKTPKHSTTHLIHRDNYLCAMTEKQSCKARNYNMTSVSWWNKHKVTWRLFLTLFYNM